MGNKLNKFTSAYSWQCLWDGYHLFEKLKFKRIEQINSISQYWYPLQLTAVNTSLLCTKLSSFS